MERKPVFEIRDQIILKLQRLDRVMSFGLPLSSWALFHLFVIIISGMFHQSA